MWFPEPLEGTDYDNDSVDNSYYEDDDKNVYIAPRKPKSLGSRGSMVVKLKLK